MRTKASAYNFWEAHLANKGAREVWDAILQVQSALKGATPALTAPTLAAVNDVPVPLLPDQPVLLVPDLPVPVLLGPLVPAASVLPPPAAPPKVQDPSPDG